MKRNTWFVWTAMGLFVALAVMPALWQPVTQSAVIVAMEETIKCPKCGKVQSKFLPDGKERTACEKCGYSIKAFAADKGPDKIDEKILATYPKVMQDIYSNLFSKRCSKCHTLARPINTTFTPSKWEKYVKLMMRKPGSGIKPAEAKQIWQFLVYDTVKRKGKELEKELKNLTAAEKEKEKEVAEKIVKEVEGGS